MPLLKHKYYLLIIKKQHQEKPPFDSSGFYIWYHDRRRCTSLHTYAQSNKKSPRAEYTPLMRVFSADCTHVRDYVPPKCKETIPILSSLPFPPVFPLSPPKNVYRRMVGLKKIEKRQQLQLSLALGQLLAQFQLLPKDSLIASTQNPLLLASCQFLQLLPKDTLIASTTKPVHALHQHTPTYFFYLKMLTSQPAVPVVDGCTEELKYVLRSNKTISKLK